ncbi:MAG TPA: ABC transporter ATP-binding protein, partial [Acidimicrobiales bacterium]|nr:ABC transporter ATP-binding protein [Acidimicrobiales bacterium]
MGMGMGHMAHMGMGGRGGGWGLMRSFRRDESVVQEQLPPGIVRRVLRFAAPYKRMLAVFLGLIVADALLGAVNPLILRAILDDGILHHHKSLVVGLALLVGALAVVDAGLSLWQRYVSANIGEGLIFDMRARVFAHVQRMPIAFFTRTQTGALVTRLNNDVLGAQQAFTDTFSSVVGNVIGVGTTLAFMFYLSWKLTLVSLALLPIFLVPARWVGRRLASITRESYALNAAMNTTMTERFNVSGALLVKLFGSGDRERAVFERRAGRVRDIGVTQAMYTRVFMAALLLTASLATAVVYGWGGVFTIDGAFQIGTLVALTAYLNRLYGPLTALSNVQVDVMSALVSFDRVFEVLDLPPMIDQKDDARPVARGPATVEFDHVDFSYPTAEEVSLASLESVAVLEQAPTQQVLHDVTFTAEPGQLVALVGPSGAGKTTISHLVPRLYDVREGAV